MNNRKVLFIGALIVDVVSAMTGRLAFDYQSSFFLAISMLSLAAIGYFFIRLMKEYVSIILNVTLLALGAINVTVFSFLFFNERITWFQGLGMAVIVIGLILIQVYAPKEEVKTVPALAPKGLKIQFSAQFRIKLINTLN